MKQFLRYIEKDERVIIGEYRTYTVFGHFSLTLFEVNNEIKFEIRNESVPTWTCDLRELDMAVESPILKDAIRKLVDERFPVKASMNEFMNMPCNTNTGQEVIDEDFETASFSWKIFVYEGGWFRLWCHSIPIGSKKIEDTYKINDDEMRSWAEAAIRGNKKCKRQHSRVQLKVVQ